MQYARCDNAGENGDFEMACKQDSPGTPQQKSHAELKLLPSLIRYMPSSMEESFHPFWEMAYGLKPTQPTILKTVSWLL